MTALMQEIERQAEQLSAGEREILAERLLAGMDDAALTDVDVAWIEEAERRYAAWKAGMASAIPAEQALAAVRAELRK